MEYRALGATGLRVSEIGLGCEGFIGKTEEYTRRVENFLKTVHNMIEDGSIYDK